MYAPLPIFALRSRAYIGHAVEWPSASGAVAESLSRGSSFRSRASLARRLGCSNRSISGFLAPDAGGPVWSSTCGNYTSFVLSWPLLFLALARLPKLQVASSSPVSRSMRGPGIPGRFWLQLLGLPANGCRGLKSRVHPSWARSALADARGTCSGAELPVGPQRRVLVQGIMSATGRVLLRGARRIAAWPGHYLWRPGPPTC